MFEPGFTPGTGLSREHGENVQRIGRLLERFPGVSSPRKSGPVLAALALDEEWAHLDGGDFVVKTKQRSVEPFAQDTVREARLWDATTELLARSA
ncbi:hypothetical protein [Microbacterium sp. cf046]|uniref:hypothetical protein n=1 Tax=Microbacterium sp. cf046 TaxID=1761803 RepID=UPI000B861294|nr:hypothetical protein [Microbacterium sp. cf046]